MSPLRRESLYDGSVERLVLSRPKANLLDQEMITALVAALAELSRRPGLRLLVLEGEGAHFSFGASIEEHLPDAVGAMLPAFHRLFRDLEASRIPTAAVVRGQCLGGGAELALWCGQVFADPSAKIGLPEVRLAVFPPVAALSLRWRTTGARATRLVLTGESVDAAEALALGLVDEVSADPEAAWRAWYESRLADRSPAALRFAWEAARRPIQRALEEDLPALEDLYLLELMRHADATEGLHAYLERRRPVWRNA